ncbi:MAG: hypothetical protein ACPLXM_13100 [Bacteroidales bacterium]
MIQYRIENFGDEKPGVRFYPGNRVAEVERNGKKRYYYIASKKEVIDMGWELELLDLAENPGKE